MLIMRTVLTHGLAWTSSDSDTLDRPEYRGLTHLEYPEHRHRQPCSYQLRDWLALFSVR